jgi:hypothetical protein
MELDGYCGKASKVLLDGEDISQLLTGVKVDVSLDRPTMVTLFCYPNIVELKMKLPEAQVILAPPEE